jgi:hypothetical protein
MTGGLAGAGYAGNGQRAEFVAGSADGCRLIPGKHNCQQAKTQTSEAKAAAGEAAINLAKTLGEDHPDTQWARQAARL